MEKEKHYGCSCPKCGFDFVGIEPYEVDGVDYPIITGEYWSPEHNWDETHKCKKCKILVEFSDGV